MSGGGVTHMRVWWLCACVSYFPAVLLHNLRSASHQPCSDSEGKQLDSYYINYIFVTQIFLIRTIPNQAKVLECVSTFVAPALLFYQENQVKTCNEKSHAWGKKF